jgi:hypothetical protein
MVKFRRISQGKYLVGVQCPIKKSEKVSRAISEIASPPSFFAVVSVAVRMRMPLLLNYRGLVGCLLISTTAVFQLTGDQLRWIG